MVALPEDTPETIPEPLTVATKVLLLLHVPPGAASTIVAEAPTHTALLPVMGTETGNAFTAKDLVATEVPQILVTL